MTERLWLACHDSRQMLAVVKSCGRASARKCRLLVCAVARSVWQALSDERSRRAVEGAEAFADGLASHEDLRGSGVAAWEAQNEISMAFIEARRATRGKYRRHVKEAAMRANASAVAAWAAADEPLGFWNSTTHFCGDPLDFYDGGAAVEALLDRYHALVREVFGSPYTPARPDSVWLGGAAAVDLARWVYEENAFEQLPVLADALEETGCTHHALLEHLRGPGPHARGCWAVDVILHKE